MAYNYPISVTLFHLAMVVPVLLYVGINKQNSSQSMYYALLFLGVALLFYHLLNYITNYKKGTPTSIFLFHLIAIMPIIMYIGYYQNQVTGPFYYYMLIAIAAVAGYYHSNFLFGYIHENMIVDHS